MTEGNCVSAIHLLNKASCDKEVSNRVKLLHTPDKMLHNTLDTVTHSLVGTNSIIDRWDHYSSQTRDSRFDSGKRKELQASFFYTNSLC